MDNDMANIILQKLNEIQATMATKEEVNELKDRIETLQESVNRLEERMTALEERMTALEERVTRLEERVTKLEERMDQLEKEIIELEKRTKNVEVELTKVKTRVRTTEVTDLHMETDFGDKIAILMDAEKVNSERHQMVMGMLSHINEIIESFSQRLIILESKN